MLDNHISEVDLKIYYLLNKEPLSDALLRRYLAELPLFIQRSIHGYRRWQDRQAALFGKLLLLRALSSYDQKTAREKIESLQTTGHGKPYIPGGPEFNISHSGEIVVMAFNQQGTGAVGIDIEIIRTIRAEDFIQYIPEVTELQMLGDTDTVCKQFFELWTQKEAVLKCSGVGVGAGLEHVALQGGAALFAGTPWFIKKISFDDRYSCHLASDRAFGNIQIEQVYGENNCNNLSNLLTLSNG